MELSFGMIFSIILIVAFLLAAFFAIKYFLDFQREIKYKQFEENLQSDIDRLWQSSSGSKQVEYILPKGVRAICFTDGEFENIEYRSKDMRVGTKLEHFDSTKTIGSSSVLCIDVFESRVQFKLNKNYGEPLVSVSKI